MDRIKDYTAIFIWCCSILAFCWIPAQGDFNTILICIIGGFGSYWYLSQSSLDTKVVIAISVIVRVLVVPNFPNLSDDIYRFIWDGRLTQAGYHPFISLPSEIINQYAGVNQELYEHLNSPSYYSIYPIVPQLIFWLSTISSSLTYMSEAIVMKTIHLVFELGTLRLVWLLLKQYQLPSKYWLLYALNPLIIVEVLANVHHEGIMLFFILASLYFINGQKMIIAGSMMAMAICTKILPLLLCPLIFFHLKGRERWTFTITCVVITGSLFSPIILGSNIISNLSDSAGLYMSTFEYNGGIYYLLRWWGYMIYGYNVIGTLGPILKVISALSILGIAVMYGPKIKKEQLPLFMMLSYGIYTILSITIHPWYIVMLIGLSVFTSYRFALIWSCLIMLTYINYSYALFHENMWVVLVEYVLVFAFVIREVRLRAFQSVL